jgi:hypothetical protein
MIDTYAYFILRRFMGVLEFALGPLVLLFGSFGQNGPEWYYSISASAYTNAAPIFHAMMGAVGLFLMAHGVACLEAYSKQDFFINFVAGIFALLIAFFSCYTTAVERAGVYPLPIGTSALIHNISAAAFFFLRAYNNLFLFTKRSPNPTPEKLKRNRVYIVCGIGIFVFMGWQAVTSYFLKLGGPWTMVNEIVMLSLFDSVSWLTKSEAWFKDKISQAKLQEQA